MLEYGSLNWGEEYTVPFNLDFEIVSSEMYGDFARETVQEVRRINRVKRGKQEKITIDGVKVDEPPARIKITSVVVASYSLVQEMLDWIAAQIELHSPVLTGKYAKSHRLYADGEMIDFYAEAPFAQEYVFINAQPYARKIERGMSSRAPEGVYQVVAALARRRFAELASISYSYRLVPSLVKARTRSGRFRRRRLATRDAKNPAVIVKMYG